MQITWYGQSCFQITASKNKNEAVSIVINPFSPESGLKLPPLEAGILLVSCKHKDYNNVQAVSANPFLIEGQGEYEIKDVFIQGIPGETNTIYTIEAEDLKICHLGNFNQKELTSEQLEKIGDVDILMIPVGGADTISSKEALKIMSQIEPKITIPMHYAIPKLKAKLDPLDKFLKALGVKSLEPEKKLVIKKKDIAPDEAKIIALKP